MKKFIFLSMVLFYYTASAQQEKGDLAIQFSGNYLSQKVKFNGEEFKTSTGSIYMKLGQFFTQNLELGVKPNVFFFLQPDEKDSKKQKLKTNVGFGLYGTYSF